MESSASPQRSARAVFGRAHVPLPTAREAAAADVAAQERFGVPQRLLMESAGRAAALVLHRVHERGSIVGVAGSGNNGGDLLVMLRVLHEWGRDVTVIAAGSAPPDRALLHGTELPFIDADRGVTELLASADVIVDGMLGTGSRGPPRGRTAALIAQIDASGRPVCALDLPSGVDADTGSVAEPAIDAQLTVCFGWPKLGLLLQPARQRCGRLIAVEIGFPPASLQSLTAQAITPSWAAARLRARAPDAHKGSVGRLLVLAGSSGMAGAAALAAEAASRAGAGLVRIASDAANRDILQTLVPEATFVDRARLADADVAPMHALVAGPGLGTDAASRQALDRALQLMPDRPALLDADALNILAADHDSLAAVAARRPVVITPHAGELARLTRQPAETIAANAPGAARATARRFGCVVLLKGQPSLVAAPDGALCVNTVGSSDLASAGMGDQLAGVIGALLAGGNAPLEAACLGLFLSGRAADIAGLGRSLTPRDVSAHLAAALADPGLTSSALQLPFITFDQPPRW
jgi:ADP-dependent NAD(P)H-hydrate dehydratase / NAD(P)H-hydrate epimerase